MLNGGLFLDKKENIMNKKIKEYFIAKGLVIEKNQGYGVINNYEVNLNVEMLHQVCPVQLHFSMHVEDDKKEQIINDLNSLGFKRITFEFTPYGLFVGLIYMLFIYIVSSLINTGFAVTTTSIIMILSGVIAGIIGGIVGVNIK